MQEQQLFLQNKLIPVLRQVQAAQAPLWGKMNARQMVEHLLDFFQVSTGKLHFPLVSPAEHLPKLRAFLLSDKPFRENTKAPASVLGEDPLPLRFETLEEALGELEAELQYFFQLYADEPEFTTTHPVFGDLNFEDWVRLHYKHVTHHLRQFNLL
jgi:hypothetical protein